MSAEKAYRIGLVNEFVPHDKLDDKINDILKMIKTSGPEAVDMAKKLVSSVAGMTEEQYKPFTAEMIAKLRLSDEGQEGMSAFLEKRKPNWVKE
jgi:methylglutaconyl-CoA hydratase